MLPPFEPTKSLADLREEDLLHLIEDGVKEGIEIDYKRDLPNDAIEFCRDLSSFANQRGGYLIYGMDEVDKRPTGLVPLQNYQGERSQGRLHNWALEGIRPRFPFRCHSVSVSGAGNVLVLEVPKSWIGPHEVRQEHRFYKRNDHGKDPMDVDELRMAFGLERSFRGMAEKFCKERGSYWEQRTPDLGTRLVLMLLHVLPLESMAGQSKIDLMPKQFRFHPVDPPDRLLSGPIAFNGRPNLEGYLFSASGKANVTIQIFRAGAVEFKACPNPILGSDPPFLVNAWLDRFIPEALGIATRMLAELQVNPPAAAFVSLIGAKGWTISENGQATLEEAHILSQEVMLDSWEEGGNEAAIELGNVLWNAVGLTSSPYAK